MTGNRRTFVKSAVAAGAGAVVASHLGGRLFAADEPEGLPVWRRPQADKAPKPLKILILGGTGFLGPHTVDYALARGHEVTLFNRGKRNPGMFPNLETIMGDRDGKLDGLKNRKWDAVVDNSGYVPRIVKLSADLLAPNVGQYLFISSISRSQVTSCRWISRPIPAVALSSRTERICSTRRGCSRTTSQTFASPASIFSRHSPREWISSGGSAEASGTAPFAPTGSRQGSSERAAGLT